MQIKIARHTQIFTKKIYVESEAKVSYITKYMTKQTRLTLNPTLTILNDKDHIKTNMKVLLPFKINK